MKSSAWLALVFFFMVACTHTPVKDDVPPPPLNLRPPNIKISSDQDRNSQDQLLMQLNLVHQEKNVQWYTNFRRAQLWTNEKPLLACELFGQLASEKLFPLNELAQLRAYETCDPSHLATFHLPEMNWQSFDPIFKTQAREVALKRAQLDGNKPLQLKLLLDKSRENAPTDERLTILNDAVALAQELRDDKSTMEAKTRIYRLAPRLNPTPTASDFMNIALDFRRHREFQKASTIYRKILRNQSRSIGERIQAFRGLRQTYKLWRDRDSFLKTSLQLVAFVSKKLPKYKNQPQFLKTYEDISLDVARALWTNGRGDQARALIRQVSSNLQGHANLSDAYLILGRMREERKDSKSALGYFQKAYAQAETKSEKSHFLWFVAWNQRKLGLTKEAADNFDKLRTAVDDPYTRNRSTFWLIKCLESLGDTARAKVELEQLITDDPTGYYGLLAYRELKKPIPSRSANKQQILAEADPSKSLLKDVYDTNLVNWLLSVEEKDLAAKTLDFAGDSLRTRSNATAEMWQELFTQYLRAESYTALNDQLSRLPNTLRVELLDRHPEFLFPSPYSEIVNKSAQQFSLSKELIYSIMRQESSFNPTARSMADAFGLMQVLPELAMKTKTEAQVTVHQAEDLYDPHINIPIGAAYLRQLWNHYHGQFVLVVANYNAAEDAIQSWLNTRWRGDTLEFIEDIPYEETRGYVRLVMRNLIFYNLLSAPPEGMPFPEWVLDIKPLST